jgi:hypothetical protein
LSRNGRRAAHDAVGDDDGDGDGALTAFRSRRSSLLSKKVHAPPFMASEITMYMQSPRSSNRDVLLLRRICCCVDEQGLAVVLVGRRGSVYVRLIVYSNTILRAC